MISRPTPRPARFLSLSALALSCTLAPFAGCRAQEIAPAPPNTTPNTQPDAPPIPPPDTPTVPPQDAPAPRPGKGGGQARARAGLPVALVADKARYARNQTLSFTITLRNASEVAQSLRFTSGQDFDLIARRADQEDAPVAWRWAAGKIFSRDLRNISLRPGEERIFTATWDQSTVEGEVLARGSYVITAEIASNPRLLGSSTTVELAN